MEQAFAFLLFAVVAAGTPGPSNVMLTVTGANAGVLGGLPCLFGVVAGMGLMLFLVPLGLGTVVLAQPWLLDVLHGAGAAFLLWLAWCIGRSRAGPEAGDGAAVGFRAALAFQWVNPKSWVVSASAAGTYLQADAGGALMQAVLMGALFCIAALPACLVWLAFGAALQRSLREPRRLRVFNLTMAALLVLSIGLIVG